MINDIMTFYLFIYIIYIIIYIYIIMYIYIYIHIYHSGTQISTVTCQAAHDHVQF